MKNLMRGFACALFIALPAMVTAQATAKTASSPPAKPAGSLAQIMRGVYFPNANLIYDVQQHDPGAPAKKGVPGGSATDTYANTYSGGEVVENAAVALADGVDLILMPGRSCQNGKAV